MKKVFSWIKAKQLIAINTIKFNKKINQNNIVFAPHIYQNHLDYIKPTMQHFEKEAELLAAPILVAQLVLSWPV